MASLDKVAQLMTAMSANYVNYKLTKEAIAFNTRILSDIPDDILEAATLDICSRPGAFFPSVGDWRQKALDIKLNKAGIPNAYEAWEELLSMIGEKGHIHFTGEQAEVDDLVEDTRVSAGQARYVEAVNDCIKIAEESSARYLAVKFEELKAKFLSELP